MVEYPVKGDIMRDTEEILTCPACGEKMTKLRTPNSDFFIDVCDKGCGGIYFDNRELERIGDDIEYIEEFLENKTLFNVSHENQRICPDCKAPMVETYTSPKKEIKIDCCHICGGKFLDYDELKKIKKQIHEGFMKKMLEIKNQGLPR